LHPGALTSSHCTARRSKGPTRSNSALCAKQSCQTYGLTPASSPPQAAQRRCACSFYTSPRQACARVRKACACPLNLGTCTQGGHACTQAQKQPLKTLLPADPNNYAGGAGAAPSPATAAHISAKQSPEALRASPQTFDGPGARAHAAPRPRHAARRRAHAGGAASAPTSAVAAIICARNAGACMSFAPCAAAAAGPPSAPPPPPPSPPPPPPPPPPPSPASPCAPAAPASHGAHPTTSHAQHKRTGGSPAVLVAAHRPNVSWQSPGAHRRRRCPQARRARHARRWPAPP